VLIALYLPTVRTKHSNPSEYFFIFLNLKIMFKSLNLNYIHIYIVAVFLAVGCAKESLSPDQTDAILAMAHTDHPEGPDPDPEVDCKCYMSITGVEWAEGAQPFSAAGLFDCTPFSGSSGSPFEIDVIVNAAGTVLWQSGGMSGLLPSPFFELNPPSNGWHTFKLVHEFKVVSINTAVKCYLQNSDGSETLATTTYHSFETEESPTDPFTIFPPKEFSCLVLPDGGGLTPKDN
jgi:hypothetical protein